MEVACQLCICAEQGQRLISAAVVQQRHASVAPGQRHHGAESLGSSGPLTAQLELSQLAAHGTVVQRQCCQQVAPTISSSRHAICVNLEQASGSSPGCHACSDSLGAGQRHAVRSSGSWPVQLVHHRTHVSSSVLLLFTGSNCKQPAAVAGQCSQLCCRECAVKQHAAGRPACSNRHWVNLAESCSAACVAVQCWSG